MMKEREGIRLSDLTSPTKQLHKESHLEPQAVKVETVCRNTLSQDGCLQAVVSFYFNLLT